MPNIKVLDKEFEPYLSEEIIQSKISELAIALNKEYAGKRPIFLSILNGSFLFTADLFKQITIEKILPIQRKWFFTKNCKIKMFFCNIFSCHYPDTQCRFQCPFDLI